MIMILMTIMMSTSENELSQASACLILLIEKMEENRGGWGGNVVFSIIPITHRGIEAVEHGVPVASFFLRVAISLEHIIIPNSCNVYD